MDESNAQRLVLAQIIQDMKNQEDAQQSNVQETIQALQTDLDRKEYVLQNHELKIYHYEKYLQRKGLLDEEARHLLNKFQMPDQPDKEEQRVSNVVSENQALKDQMKETIKDVNRLERSNNKAKNTINELKLKIERMKKRHAQQLFVKQKSPEITASDRKMQVSHLDRDIKKMGSSDVDESPSFHIKELPSLRCSIIDSGGAAGQEARTGHGLAINDRVDWNDLLVRESFPDDYGTIRVTDTHRENNKQL